MKRFLGCLLALALAAPSVQAGVSFELQAFDAGNTQLVPGSPLVMLGDAITIRLVAIDEAGIGPDFTTDSLLSFNAQLTSNNADGGSPAVTFNPGLPNSASFGSFPTALNIGASVGPAGPISVTSPVTLAEFTYNVASPGDTTFDLTPGVTDATFTGGPTVAPGVSGVTVSAVPEPGSIGLLACGLAVCGRKLRRRKAAAA